MIPPPRIGNPTAKRIGPSPPRKDARHGSADEIKLSGILLVCTLHVGRGPAAPDFGRVLAALTAAAVLALAAITAGCGSKSGGDLPAASIAGGGNGQNTATGNAGPNAPVDRLHPVVQLHTTRGDINIKLDAEHAPITVDNFLSYLDKGQYDNTLFHQVVPGVLILGGGYDTFGKEKPTGSPIRNEAHNGLKNRRGTIAMARRPDVVDSSTCQFFINLADNPSLDYKKPAAKVVDFRSVRGPAISRSPMPATMVIACSAKWCRAWK